MTTCAALLNPNQLYVLCAVTIYKVAWKKDKNMSFDHQWLRLTTITGVQWDLDFTSKAARLQPPSVKASEYAISEPYATPVTLGDRTRASSETLMTTFEKHYKENPRWQFAVLTYIRKLANTI